MKKFFTYLLAFAAVATVISCSKSDGPEEPLPGPKITWESNPDFDKMDITDKMDVKIKVEAPAGIKTFKVSVESEALKDLGITEIDLIEPDENIKPFMDLILGNAGSPKNKTEYSLDLSTLVPLINGLTNEESDHTFTVTVGDNNDQTATKTAVFHRVAEETSGQDFTETVNGVSFNMVYVKGGTFSMGATEEQGSVDPVRDEYPVHSVTLSDYYIGKFEVTQGLWKAVMGTTIEQQRDKEDKELHLYGVGSDYPMYYVSWDEAREFCAKLSQLTGKKYSLPTEAQWEYAARGGAKSKSYKYSGSNTVGDVAWYWGNSDEESHPVGKKQANELGIYDMSGNVKEWCNDWYADYSSDSQTDPTGPTNGSVRVDRGGCWFGVQGGCCVSSRGIEYRVNHYRFSGFRVALLP